MDDYTHSPADRAKGIAGALLLQALLGYALWIGLAPGAPIQLAERALVYVTPVAAPPPPPVPIRTAARRPAGAASKPNRVASATPVIAPPPVIPVFVPPPPIVAAPVAGIAADSSAGAAPVVGPGSGSGGAGDETGSGSAGDGTGSGGTPSVWLRGRIRDSDYPRAAIDARLEGTLMTRYVIGTNGRVIACRVTEPSGNAVLDDTTCRLVMQRYRYRPARDASGRKVTEEVLQKHSWVIVRPGEAEPFDAGPGEGD